MNLPIFMLIDTPFSSGLMRYTRGGHETAAFWDACVESVELITHAPLTLPAARFSLCADVRVRLQRNRAAGGKATLRRGFLHVWWCFRRKATQVFFRGSQPHCVFAPQPLPVRHNAPEFGAPGVREEWALRTDPTSSINSILYDVVKPPRPRAGHRVKSTARL
jgi:hypothetical protein